METESEAVQQNVAYLNEERYKAIERTANYDELRTQARHIKEEAIENLPSLIKRVRESVEANGGSVYLATDAADANEHIAETITERRGTSVVKSKSMTTEEIDLNAHLQATGVDVWETDLGEFVIQVADESPSHIVGPSLHKSRTEIADLFNEVFDPDPPLETAEELTRFARDYLGERIMTADVGITGANFVVADSGTLVLVTNEGNARKCAVTPDTHIAVAGVEKLLPNVRDLEPFLGLISRAATGQDVPQYLSFLTPPVDTPTVDFARSEGSGIGHGDDREFHLVLVDNGRTAMRTDEDLRETLYCIRCGACANSCANFQHVGGHAFGGETYTGGIATGWEAGVHGLDSAAEFNDLCTGCSRCVNACPVEIDIPWINTVVRDRVNRGTDPNAFGHLVEGLTPDTEPAGLDLQKRFFGNFPSVAKLGSTTAPLSNRLAGTRPVRWFMERFIGIDRRRTLPSFHRTTLREWFVNRPSIPDAEAADRSVVLYPDPYTNYVDVNRGKAAVRVLEALGVTVQIPEVGASGRAPLSQGMLSTGRSQARDTADTLIEHLDAGHDVVVIEPSDLAMFQRDYGRLLETETFERLRDGSYEVIEYVYGLLEHGADPDNLAAAPKANIAYHAHCQQRTLGLEVYTEAVFDRLGYETVTSDVECCGMAGSFGYKTQYYELSMNVGESLRDQLAADGAENRLLVASGTSCLEQLEALFDSPCVHPVEVLDPEQELE